MLCDKGNVGLHKQQQHLGRTNIDNMKTSNQPEPGLEIEVLEEGSTLIVFRLNY